MKKMLFICGFTLIGAALSAAARNIIEPILEPPRGFKGGSSEWTWICEQQEERVRDCIKNCEYEQLERFLISDQRFFDLPSLDSSAFGYALKFQQPKTAKLILEIAKARGYEKQTMHFRIDEKQHIIENYLINLINLASKAS